MAIARRERDEANAKIRGKWTPRMRDWDLTAILLREIRESVVAVRQAVIQTTFVPAGEGKTRPLKAPPVALLPAPETEVDRMRVRLSRLSQLEIIATVAPWALTAEMREELGWPS